MLAQVPATIGREAPISTARTTATPQACTGFQIPQRHQIAIGAIRLTNQQALAIGRGCEPTNGQMIRQCLHRLQRARISKYDINIRILTGDQKSALESYERLIELDHNNYEGNLGIGLIYLEDYLKNPESRTAQNRAQEYLLRANQINPSGINTLRSLAVLYQQKGDIIQLERVNNILDQLTLH